MANITVYTFDSYKDDYNKVFAGVYNDFKLKAAEDYKFELEPLDYDDFIKSINDELVKCIILFEQDVPTGFLAYTTVISESVELNIIHVIGDENSMQKRCLLLQNFLELNSEIIKQKIVTFAVLGKQEEIVPELSKFGFKTVNQSVMKFDFLNSDYIKNLRDNPLPRPDDGFELINWDDNYYNEASEVVHFSFRDMSDAKFDPRFSTIRGTQDIISKIVTGVYGEFLNDETKILLFEGKPVGFCFANLTNDSIANIPLVAVNNDLRGKNLGIFLLQSVVTDVYTSVANGKRKLVEINASCDTDNIPAYKMYEKVGFKELYSYKQSYRDIS